MKKIGLLAILLLIGSFIAIGKVYAPAGTNLYLQFQGEPYSTREKTYGPTPMPIGTIFTVTVYGENFTDVYALAFGLTWNPAVLNLTSHYDLGIPGWVPHIYKGDFLEGSGITTGFLIGVVDYTAGTADDITYGRTGIVAGKTGVGPGICATIQFTIVGFGDSAINLRSCDIVDSSGTSLPGYPKDSPYDLTVHVVQPGPTPPTVDFTWATTLLHVTFTATGTPGFDGTNTCPITHYYWDWENDGVIDLDNGPSPGPVSHDYPAEAIYDVNCSVYAPPGVGADPSYNPRAFKVHAVQTKAPTLGRAIDLYTQDTRYPGYTTAYTGKYALAGTQVDSYAPQDIVILYANVTYNLEPVAHKLVTFKIKGPINVYENISFFRTAFTNLKGIAEINFTIPVPCDHFREITFGNWTIEAKVDIVDQTIDDWHWFLVGWIIEKTDLSLGDGLGLWDLTEFEELTWVYFKVTVVNIAMESRNVTFTAVIYDELNVPIGSVTWNPHIITPGPHPNTYLVTIYIPEWAFVGWGKVYFNCYTKNPWNCGIPYCPENSEDIKITPGLDP
jgi:hypothetical protein